VDNPSEDIVGINFSEQVYDDKDGISQENAIWVNGRVFSVGKINFQMDEKQPTSKPWKITTANPEDEIQITLQLNPFGYRDDLVNVGLIHLSYIQPYGEYSGTITIKGEKTISIKKAYGFTETHYAKW